MNDIDLEKLATDIFKEDKKSSIKLKLKALYQKGVIDGIKKKENSSNNYDADWKLCFSKRNVSQTAIIDGSCYIKDRNGIKRVEQFDDYYEHCCSDKEKILLYQKGDIIDQDKVSIARDDIYVYYSLSEYGRHYIYDDAGNVVIGDSLEDAKKKYKV